MDQVTVQVTDQNTMVFVQMACIWGFAVLMAIFGSPKKHTKD